MIGVQPFTVCRELKRGRDKIGKHYWVIKSHKRPKIIEEKEGLETLK